MAKPVRTSPRTSARSASRRARPSYVPAAVAGSPGAHLQGRPLSREDAERLLGLLCDPTTPAAVRANAEEALLLGHIAWIVGKTQEIWPQFDHRLEEYEDILSAACWGFVDGLKHWDPSIGESDDLVHSMRRYVNNRIKLRVFAAVRHVTGRERWELDRMRQVTEVVRDLEARGEHVNDDTIVDAMTARGYLKPLHRASNRAKIRQWRTPIRIIAASDVTDLGAAEGRNGATQSASTEDRDADATDENGLLEQVEDCETPLPDDAIERESMRALIRTRVRAITDPRRRLMLALVFAVPLYAASAYDQSPMTAPEVALLLGCSSNAVAKTVREQLGYWRHDPAFAF